MKACEILRFVKISQAMIFLELTDTFMIKSYNMSKRRIFSLNIYFPIFDKNSIFSLFLIFWLLIYSHYRRINDV